MMEYTIYTDGGCSGNKRDSGCKGAWAYVILDPAKNMVYQDVSGEENTTNNRMELMAVIRGLGTCCCFDRTIKHECIVLTDSKYVADNYNDYLQEWKKNGWRKSNGGQVLNFDLWKELSLLIPEFKSVKIKWVKGHAVNVYNQIADSLVRSVLYPTK
jgi:ribonuclease HI